MLAYRLVYHGIGGRTVKELIESGEMTREEFMTWAAFFALEPRGDERADWHAAMLLGQQANMNRRKGQPRIPYSRFLPKWQYRPKRRKRPEEMRDAVRQQWGLPPKETEP